MRYLASSAHLLSLLIFSACATSPDGTGRPLSGTAGPVEWEVTDVGRVDRADGMRSRWSFTIVLREKAGTAIQFERIESGAHGHLVEAGGVSRVAFNRRLDARSELRHSTVDTWGWVSYAGSQFGGAAALGSVTIERRFIGKDANGQMIVVPVRVDLHRGFGRRSRQPASPERPIPPIRLLQAADLTGLAGRWEGYYQFGAFQVPLEATIGEDGAVEVRENDPVTNRFRGSLSIRDGRVSYAGRDTGELVLHQEGATRLLIGRLTLAGSGSAPPEIIPVRLEWRATSGTSAASPAPSTPPATVARTGPAPIESVPAGPVTGTYRGTVSGDQQGRSYSAQITVTLAQQGDQLSGTWLTVGGASGTVKGRLVSPTRAELRVEQLHPCPAQFTGAATIGEGGSSLGGSYSGTGCAGPVSTSFTVVRQ